MTQDHFILAMSIYLDEAGVANPLSSAARYVLDHPDIVADTTPQDAVEELITCHAYVHDIRQWSVTVFDGSEEHEIIVSGNDFEAVRKEALEWVENHHGTSSWRVVEIGEKH